jgi:hypothetical protein
VDALELPHHDQGGEDLDQGIQAETGQGRGTGANGGGGQDSQADHVPAQGRVFKAQPAAQQDFVRQCAGNAVNPRHGFFSLPWVSS